MYALPAVLAFLALAAAVLRGRDACICAIVLLGNWLVNTIGVTAAGRADPWLLFLAVDYATAIILFDTRMSRGRIAIVAIYGLQLVAHGSYGLSDHHGRAPYLYYWCLFYLAWVQALIMGGWVALRPVSGFWDHSGFRGGVHDLDAVRTRVGAE